MLGRRNRDGPVELRHGLLVAPELVECIAERRMHGGIVGTCARGLVELLRGVAPVLLRQVAPAEDDLGIDGAAVAAHGIERGCLCLGHVTGLPPVEGDGGLDGHAAGLGLVRHHECGKRLLRLVLAVPDGSERKRRGCLLGIGAHGFLECRHGVVSRAALAGDVAHRVQRVRAALAVLHRWERDGLPCGLERFGIVAGRVERQRQVRPRARHAGIDGERLAVRRHCGRVVAGLLRGIAARKGIERTLTQFLQPARLCLYRSLLGVGQTLRFLGDASCLGLSLGLRLRLLCIGPALRLFLDAPRLFLAGARLVLRLLRFHGARFRLAGCLRLARGLLGSLHVQRERPENGHQDRQRHDSCDDRLLAHGRSVLARNQRWNSYTLPMPRIRVSSSSAARDSRRRSGSPRSSGASSSR